MFMHNGQVGGFHTIRRRVEALIPDEYYDLRGGTTDSEVLFLAAMGFGLEHDPPAAIGAMLAAVRTEMERAGISQALRFAAALTDGHTLWAFRWSSDARPPTLYYRSVEEGLVVVSEPTDEDHATWHAVAPNSVLIAAPGRALEIKPFDPAIPGRQAEAAD
jgi:predicted glutamine amidotransferase